MDGSQVLNVYIKPGCPWCVSAIAFLKNEGFEFREIDVIAHDDKFAEMREISGQTFAPTLRVGENNDLVLADFDVDELKVFLEEHGIGPG